MASKETEPIVPGPAASDGASYSLPDKPLPAPNEALQWAAPYVLTHYLSDSREHSNCCAIVLDRLGTLLTRYTASLWLYDLARLASRLDPVCLLFLSKRLKKQLS